ncbi:hypothetical protein EDC01DRAFT_764865 [Geopyxis carbonaria]|nr:hypothetical protein EDC01DRAFT_764865 [Geopyxis carbonaria]
MSSTRSNGCHLHARHIPSSAAAETKSKIADEVAKEMARLNIHYVCTCPSLVPEIVITAPELEGGGDGESTRIDHRGESTAFHEGYLVPPSVVDFLGAHIEKQARNKALKELKARVLRQKMRDFKMRCAQKEKEEKVKLLMEKQREKEQTASAETKIAHDVAMMMAELNISYVCTCPSQTPDIAITAPNGIPEIVVTAPIPEIIITSPELVEVERGGSIDHRGESTIFELGNLVPPTIVDYLGKHVNQQERNKVLEELKAEVARRKLERFKWRVAQREKEEREKEKITKTETENQNKGGSGHRGGGGRMKAVDEFSIMRHLFN